MSDDDASSIDSTLSFIDKLRSKSVKELLVEYSVCVDAEKHLGDYKVVLREKFVAYKFLPTHQDFLNAKDSLLGDIRKARFPEYDEKVIQHFSKYPKVTK